MTDFLHFVLPGLPESKEKELAREVIAVLKHLPGKHEQASHGRRSNPAGDYSDKKDAIQSAVDKADTTKNISGYIGVRDDSVYRFITKEDYDNAIRTGTLTPGRSFDNGGTVNFSKEPIPVYGGSAFLEAGLLIEVPAAKIPNSQIYHGSKDLYLASRDPVPLSSASRIWGFQFGDPRGVQIIDVTRIAKGLS